MKTNARIIMMAALTIFLMAACNSREDTSIKSIEGTYFGSFTTETSNNLPVALTGNNTANAIVTGKGDGIIEVHCYGDELDTTLMLDYYGNNDSIMVCLTGNQFENMYGHMSGQGHMSGGMMGDRVNGETEWMHHLREEHHAGDEHFGGFDMLNNTFGFSFKMMKGDLPYNLKFQGVKQ